MKLLLQAGIHLIKKVITFVIYGRSVQVFKACTLFYFFSAEFFFSQIFLRGKVLSHRFHRYTQIFFIMIFLHRISRRNRKAFLLAGLLTDFRGILAAGQWLAPDICSCCFGHADFADDLKNVPINICVYLWNLWDKKLRWKNLCKSVKSVGPFPTSGGICNDRTGRICEICVTKKQIYTDDSPRFYTFYLVISLFNHTFASNFEVVHF